MQKGIIRNRGKAHDKKPPHYGFIAPEDGGENLYFLVAGGRVLNQQGGFTEERERRIPDIGDSVFYSVKGRNYKGPVIDRWAFVPSIEGGSEDGGQD